MKDLYCLSRRRVKPLEDEEEEFPVCLVQVSVGEAVATLGTTGDCSISTDISQWGYTGDRPLLFTRRRVKPLKDEEEEFPVCLVLLVSVGEDVTTLGSTGDCSISVDTVETAVSQQIFLSGELYRLYR